MTSRTYALDVARHIAADFAQLPSTEPFDWINNDRITAYRQAFRQSRRGYQFSPAGTFLFPAVPRTPHVRTPRPRYRMVDVTKTFDSVTKLPASGDGYRVWIARVRAAI